MSKFSPSPEGRKTPSRRKTYNVLSRMYVCMYRDRFAAKTFGGGGCREATLLDPCVVALYLFFIRLQVFTSSSLWCDLASFGNPPSVSQEVRRGAELDARAIRAEEHRLRDLAVSLEARAEEVRRLERGGARGREAALEAAKHEARQALEVREEGIARER